MYGLDDAFWRDVAVGEGALYRRVTDAGEVEWGEPGRWWKSFDYVGRPTNESRPVSYFAATEPLPGDALIAELVAAEAEAAEVEGTAKQRILVPTPTSHPADPAPGLAPDWAPVGWVDHVHDGVLIPAAIAAEGAGQRTGSTRDSTPTNLFPDADWLS